MSGRFVLRDEAKRDLVKHFAYLVERGEIDVARRFLSATEAAFHLLSEMPELGVQRQFKHRQLSNTRMWPVKEFREFLIFYQPIENGIRVLRMIHAKEDYWRSLNR